MKSVPNTLRLGTVAEFEERYAKRLPLREKHSKLGAFWHTEFGPREASILKVRWCVTPGGRSPTEVNAPETARSRKGPRGLAVLMRSTSGDSLRRLWVAEELRQQALASKSLSQTSTSRRWRARR